MSKYKLFLLVIFVAVLVWSRIGTVSPSYWLLENSPIFVIMLLFILLQRYIKLSNTSYTFIVIYMMFPLVTSHYGVTGVPLGDYVGDLLGSSRNVYDKITHFAFGFLGFYPIQEFVMSVTKKEGLFNYYIPLESVIALSALYEIFEWLAARTVNPVLAAGFFGAQGDIFDTQKDMGIATVGALCAMLIIFLYRKYKQPISSSQQKLL